MLKGNAATSKPDVQLGSMPDSEGLSKLAAECDRSSCSPAHCPILRDIGQATEFEKGEVIFREDEPNDRIYLVLSGVVCGSKVLHDGRRIIARFAFPGQLLEYDHQNRCPFTAEAITPVSAISIGRSRLDRTMNEAFCLQSMVAQSLVAELEEARLQLLALGRLSATERVAQFLY